MSNQMLSVALADIATDCARSVKRITDFHNQVTSLEAGGFPVTLNESKLRYQSDFDIDRSKLAMLRKVVGRLQVTNKYIPSDFNSRKEVLVTVAPMSKAFDMLRFTYRSPFRGGGKCHVETITSTNTYQNLVCKVQ
jgi:hypothetical protein